jgi:Autographiviridae endonuclease VII
MKRKYGLTRESYEVMLAVQGGGCAICGTNKWGKNRTRACIDHDHETGRIRGLLCQPCNSLLGMAEDNVRILASAIVYLEENL